MDCSGHRGRHHIPLGVVVKVCLYTILIDILCILLRFIFRTVNVLLAGMSVICLRLQNLREYVEIEISPEHFPIIEDFEDVSANLIDSHDTTGTSSSESSGDSSIPVSSKIIRARVPAEGSEDAEEKEIGQEKSSSFGGDFKDNSALKVVQNMTDTSPPEMKDNTASSAFSETNVADAPEEDLAGNPDDAPEKEEESEANPTVRRGKDISTLCHFDKVPNDQNTCEAKDFSIEKIQIVKDLLAVLTKCASSMNDTFYKSNKIIDAGVQDAFAELCSAVEVAEKTLNNPPVSKETYRKISRLVTRNYEIFKLKIHSQRECRN